ncbi:MAG: hypothetical protein NLN64_04270 [Candidatus Thalassarchaeaceae archaeon]|nr:hypothetical protein [Candidatus Thalassarchaeaceae archaeon]
MNNGPASSQIINYGDENMINGHYAETYTLVAFILSLLSIIFLFLGGFGIILAIPGVILANNALIKTRSQLGHPDHNMAKAALIISWITIGLSILAILGFILVFLLLGGLGVIL